MADGTAEAERFVAFAFAAAELMMEVDERGLVAFVAGRLMSDPKIPAPGHQGAEAASMIAEADRCRFATALAEARRKGRISPILVRLASGSRHVLTGVARGRERVALCFTPVLPDPEATLGALPAPQQLDETLLAQRAEALLRGGQGEGSVLSLVELSSSTA